MMIEEKLLTAPFGMLDEMMINDNIHVCGSRTVSKICLGFKCLFSMPV